VIWEKGKIGKGQGGRVAPNRYSIEVLGEEESGGKDEEGCGNIKRRQEGDAHLELMNPRPPKGSKRKRKRKGGNMGRKHRTAIGERRGGVVTMAFLRGDGQHLD